MNQQMAESNELLERLQAEFKEFKGRHLALLQDLDI